MFKALKDIFSTWKNKDKNWKNRKSKNNVNWNIYESNITLGEYTKKFHFVHFVMKYKILIPLIKIIKLFGKKYIIKEIPKKEGNEILVLFEKAYKKAIPIWQKEYFCRDTKNKKYNKLKLNINGRHAPTDRVDDLKNMFFTGLLMDTAYKPLMDIILINFVNEFIQEYKDCKEIPYIMYLPNHIYDIRFKVASDILSKELKNKKVWINDGKI